jgi:mannosylfructose-phosphate synthase
MCARAHRRILMISTHGYVAAQPEFGRPDTGGQVVYVLELSKRLAQMGYRVDILSRQFDDQPAAEAIADNVHLHRFPCGGPDFIPKEVLAEHIPEWVDHVVRWIEQDDNDDIAFINSHYWDAGVAGRLLADELGLPHVHTPHSLGVWKRDNMPGDPEEKERRYNFRRRIAEERRIFEDSSLVIATTPQQRELLQGDEYAIRNKKISVIPPGFDDTRFFPVSSATRQIIKRRLGLQGPVVLALGRMARNKGYDLLIRAMRPVIERVPGARLVLAIGSSNLSTDERLQLSSLHTVKDELGDSDRVIFQDYIPDELLPDYYRAADVFALSSRYEPFGMTAVEAMACGTPAVMTTEGGLWEQVVWGVEALYANPNDTDSFGHALCRVLMYPEIADALAEHGARKARACFTWTAIAQQFLYAAMEAIGPEDDSEGNGQSHTPLSLVGTGRR